MKDITAKISKQKIHFLTSLIQATILIAKGTNSSFMLDTMTETKNQSFANISIFFQRQLS